MLCLIGSHALKLVLTVLRRHTDMAVPGYVLKHTRATLERAEKFVSEQYFTDCNLVGR